MALHEHIRTAQAIIKSMSVPDMPVELVMLNEEIEKKFSNIVTVAHIIEKNPEMLADFINVANKVVVCKEPIRDARTATHLMGMEEIRNLYACTAIKKHLADDYYERELLSFSVKVGLAAAELSYWVQDVSRTEAYMAGLFHHVGVVYLYRRDKEGYRALYEPQTTQPFDAHDRELELLGTSHTHMGLVLAKKWHVNDNVAKAILLHHDQNFACVASHHPKVCHLAALIMVATYIVLDTQDEEFVHSQLKAYRSVALEHLALPDTALRAAESMVRKFGSTGLVVASH
ncbi:HDOD domain-containing protein [Hydrogenovibrio halophilus]|uniref:HDOD domain-containing protein n=1 Tax=Hydrogenovibrio halophilus TaxID=373391 RepID=UPI0003766F09|nr:HDOD domain-containing protein [Hydrogenovibrio halophilus]